MSRITNSTRGESTGYIPQPVLVISVESSKISENKVVCGSIGWQAIGQKIMPGITPSIISFRVLFESTRTDIITFANYREVLGFYEPESKPKSKTFGFTATGYPATVSNLRDYRERLNVVMHRSDRTYIDVWQRSASSGSNLKEAFLGRFWLTNIVGASLDGVTLVFSDARVLNYEHRMIGRYRVDSSSSRVKAIFEPYADIIFNPKMNGNHYVSGETTTNISHQQLFDKEWPNSGVSPISGVACAEDWRLWDMLQYIFLHGNVQHILQPSLREMCWRLWHDNGGNRKQAVDITGMTVTEAIDKVIRTAGDYSWTLVPATSDNWQIRVFEYSRWSAIANTQVNDSDIDDVMPARTVTIPTPGASIASTQVNIQSIAIDEHDSQRIGHLIVQGDPIIVESTFSTDGNYDFSCAPAQSVANGSGVATLEWIGDLTAWQTAYNATPGSDKLKRLAADAVDDVAYKVCALVTKTTSSVNPTSGFAFAPKDGSWQEMRRPFLPNRLPLGTTINSPGEADEKPNVIVWIRKPGANVNDWIDAHSKAGAALVGSWSIDPVVGGIRFKKALCNASDGTFDTYDVMVTACIELDECLQAEIYRHEMLGRALIIQPEREMKMGVCWNALNLDMSDNITDIVHDDTDSLQEYAANKFSEYERVRRTAMLVIPWVERFYCVGDWLAWIASGSSELTSSVAVTRQAYGSPIVGVEIDYQDPPTTTLRTESWRQ